MSPSEADEVATAEPDLPDQGAVLDVGVIVRRRNELGISVRTLAAQLGVTAPVVRLLETGRNHKDLPLGLVIRLAEALSVDAVTLFIPADCPAPSADVTGGEAPETEAEGQGDAARVGALLHTASVLTPLGTICEALGWSLARVEGAIDELEAGLSACGLRIHRLGSKVKLARAVEVVAGDELETLIRRHLNRDGINLTEARLLRCIELEGVPKELSNPERVALGVLVNGGLVEPGPLASEQGQVPLVLHPDVRFGLMLDDAPR